MFGRRVLLLAFVVIPSAWLALSTAALAEQAFARFVPFLVDLDGWKGDKPEGMAMEMTGSNMITATRQYRRDAATAHAQIIIGAAAQGALAATKTGMNIETSDGRMNTSPIDGFTVTRTYTFKQKSGAILVALSDSALFSLSFTGIADDEALALAKKFNWKSIQAALPK